VLSDDIDFLHFLKAHDNAINNINVIAAITANGAKIGSRIVKTAFFIVDGMFDTALFTFVLRTWNVEFV